MHGGVDVDETRPETPLEPEAHGQVIPERAELPRSRVREWDERARGFVRERPVVSVGVALAVGYVIARLLARR